MSFLTKCAVKPLRLDCSFCNKVASSYPYLQMNPRMMFYFACTSHHPSVQIQLISCFSHRSRSPLSSIFLKKGSPDLKQEVVLGAWNEHWLCRPLHILKAITWVCCGVQDRTLKIVIIWPHWVLNCSYLMPTYGTSWLFCPPQCTAITKLVKTGCHIGHIILAVSQMRQFDGTSMAMEEIDRSWKCHLLKYKFSYSLVQQVIWCFVDMSVPLTQSNPFQHYFYKCFCDSPKQALKSFPPLESQNMALISAKSCLRNCVIFWLLSYFLSYLHQ